MTSFLFITPSYYPNIGGVEYVTKSIVERLIKKGYTVKILTGDTNIENPIETIINGAYVIRWPVVTKEGAYHIPKHWRELKQKLNSIVKEIDIIHIHNIHSVFTVKVGLILAKQYKYKAKFIVSPHYHGTGHTLTRKLLWKLWRSYVRKLIQNVDIIHAASEYESQLLKKHFNAKPIIIGHGVEEDILSLEWTPSSKRYAMYSGRIEKYKRIEKTAKIIKLLRDYSFNFEFKIFGEGPFKVSLVKYLNKLDLKYEINGFLPRNEYLKTLSRSSFFINLSEKEAFSQTVNEANAIGVPVIAAAPWGYNFKTRSRVLIVNPKRNEKDLAKQILYFLNEAPEQSRPQVPSWNEVLDLYLSYVY